MKIIGLTGSIATGKSFVSNIIKNDFNQPVIDADKLAREIVKPQKPAYNEIIKNFGQKILLENKELNRKLLRKIIFSDPEKKELLNQITHKYIKEEFLKQADYHKKQNRNLVFYDIPLLFETNSEKDFDKIIVVYNKFKSVAQQEVTEFQLYPIKPDVEEEKPEENNYNYIFEPDKKTIIDGLLPRYLNIQLWAVLLNSYAAELGARMTAMDMATENASEMIISLQLTYNKRRQAAITNEILEIVSGANALKES